MFHRLLVVPPKDLKKFCNFRVIILLALLGTSNCHQVEIIFYLFFLMIVFCLFLSLISKPAKIYRQSLVKIIFGNFIPHYFSQKNYPTLQFFTRHECTILELEITRFSLLQDLGKTLNARTHNTIHKLSKQNCPKTNPIGKYFFTSVLC